MKPSDIDRAIDDLKDLICTMNICSAVLKECKQTIADQQKEIDQLKVKNGGRL